MDLAWLTIAVVYCAQGVEDLSEVRLPRGATVREAIAAAQVPIRWPELMATFDCGIWGRRCSLDDRLADGDRVEIYRPLAIDPKEGRRIRANLRRRAKQQ